MINAVQRITLRLWPTLFGMLLMACAQAEREPDTGHSEADQPEIYRYNVIDSVPHDRTLFTQGLLMHEGLFYESGGLYGQSRLVVYRENDPAPLREHALEPRFFAEGLTKLHDRLYLLTWRENTLLVFTADSLETVAQHTYDGEGWGLTDNGQHLIRSDGSDQLFFHSPEDFRELHRVRVTENGRPLHRLNELEAIKGFVWANIWHENRLVKIDPDNGRVVGSLDLTPLVRQGRPPGRESVLNGIAYDEKNNALWVTGKRWPRLYRLSLQPAL